jgi:hypothetical protein
VHTQAAAALVCILMDGPRHFFIFLRRGLITNFRLMVLAAFIRGLEGIYLRVVLLEALRDVGREGHHG